MQRARVGVGHGDRGIARQLPLHADGGLDQVIGAQVGIQAIDAVLRGAQVGQRGRVGKGVRVGHRIGKLVDAVEQEGLFDQALIDAVVEHAEAAADHGLLPAVLGASRRPGETDARREIAMIGDVGLPFIAQAVAQGEVGAHAPVVLREDAEIVLDDARIRIAGIDIELRRAAAQLADLGGREAGLLQGTGCAYTGPPR